jgi:heme-degrading monooxygenase HmoA
VNFRLPSQSDGLDPLPKYEIWTRFSMNLAPKIQPAEGNVTGNDMGRWNYMIAWEFRARTGAEADFERVYGPQGLWARLFEQGEGFVGTELNRDLKDPGRYLTLDFWISKDAYDRFRDQHRADYQTIDKQCEALTEREIELGRFERLA